LITEGDRQAETVGTIVGLSIRTTLGLFSGIISGLAGYLLASVVWPTRGDAMLFISGLVTAAGASGGLGASLAWLKLDFSRGALLKVLMLGLLGGVVGAWSGYSYGRVVYEDVLFSRPARMATVMAAAVLSNVTFVCWTVAAAVRSRVRSRRFVGGTSPPRLHQKHF
jgi:hypothetical protein